MSRHHDRGGRHDTVRTVEHLNSQDLDGVRWLTLAGSRGNALGPELVSALHDCVDSVPDDVHALVLRSAGRHFCVGFDLAGVERETDATLLRRFVDVELLLAAVRALPVVTIACLSGAVIGAGADLALAFDHRVAAGEVTVRFPGGAFGVVLGRGQQVARLTPYGRAAALEGSDLDVRGALRAGVVTETVNGDVVARARALAASAGALHAGTRAQLLGRSRVPVDADAELAAVVRSAARPGLARRLAAFAAANLPAGQRRGGDQ